MTALTEPDQIEVVQWVPFDAVTMNTVDGTSALFELAAIIRSFI